MTASMRIPAQPDQSADSGSGFFDACNNWSGNPLKNHQRRRTKNGKPVRLFNREIFRHHLAQHHMTEAHEGEGERECNSVKDTLRARPDQWPEHAFQQLKQCVLAGPAESETRKRYAHLHYAEKPFGISDQTQRRLRSDMTAFGELS